MLRSTQLRQEGNENYRAAFREDSSPEISLREMEKAQSCYVRAGHEASDPEQVSSAHKNVANAAWKIANLKKSLEAPVNSVFADFKSALTYFQKAINFGTYRDATWVDGVWQCQKRCLTDFVSSAIELTKGRQRAKLLEEAIAVIALDELKATCYVAIVDALFYSAVEKVQCSDYKDALALLHDSHYPLEEAARLFKGDVIHDAKVQELRRDVMVNMFIAESVQARKMGDAILEKALENDDNEDLNIDLVWIAADHYKEAIVLTRERQVECEAAALSRLGSLYYKVLKLKKKAKENFMLCIQLAISRSVKWSETEDWFKDCKQMLGELQRESLLSELEEQQAMRKKHLDMIAAEIEDLKNLDVDWTMSNDEEKIKYIYKTYPPVNENHKMLYARRVNWDDTMRRKCLQKAIVHYHPDKVDAETCGMKQKILCEEITKLLTNHYNCRKGC